MTEQSQLTHDDALARFRRGYSALLALVNDFPESRRNLGGARGEWTPQQVLAVLCGWMEEGHTRMTQVMAGDKTWRQYDEDSDYAVFNAASLAQRQNATWDEVVAELDQRSNAFYDASKAAGAAGLADDPRVREWVSWLWQECVTHMGQLTRFALD